MSVFPALLFNNLPILFMSVVLFFFFFVICVKNVCKNDLKPVYLNIIDKSVL